MCQPLVTLWPFIIVWRFSCANREGDKGLLGLGGLSMLVCNRSRLGGGSINVDVQSVAGYLGLALASVWDGALQERFYCYFCDFFASINGIFILACGMGARLSFYGV